MVKKIFGVKKEKNSINIVVPGLDRPIIGMSGDIAIWQDSQNIWHVIIVKCTTIKIFDRGSLLEEKSTKTLKILYSQIDR